MGGNKSKEKKPKNGSESKEPENGAAAVTPEPEVKNESPKVDEGSEVKEDSPEVKEDSPEVKEESPEVKEDSPEVKEESPEVKEESLEVKEDSPEVKAEEPPKEAAQEEESKGDSNESDKLVVVVFGATGSQGGSVVRAMKDDPKFKVKAVTRNVESEKAKALSEQGVEVIQANTDDPESLEKAVSGAYGVFGNTNYWEHRDPEKELTQGKNIADACLKEKVQFLVFSTLEDVKEQLGKDCHHFDAKAKISKYIKEKEIPYCGVMYSAYMENLLGMLKPRKDGDNYVIDIPMEGSAMDFIPAEEAGECMHSIFSDRDKYLGREIGLSSDKKTIEEYAEIMSRVLEKTFQASKMTTQELADMGQAEAAAMFEFYIKGTFSRDIALTKELNPDIPDFEAWVVKNKDRILGVLE